jgi:hypothetical protein
MPLTVLLARGMLRCGNKPLPALKGYVAMRRLFQSIALAGSLIAGASVSASANTIVMGDTVKTIDTAIDQVSASFTVTGTELFDVVSGSQFNWSRFTILVNTTPNPLTTLINFSVFPVGTGMGTSSIAGSGDLGPGTYYITVEAESGSSFPLSGFGIFSAYNTTFNIAATPLPSTWTMLIAGFVGLGFLAYRGTKKGSAGFAAT